MTESQLQIMVAKFLDTCLVDAWWTAINPIPAKSKTAAGISKAMGLKAGCPDILVVHNGSAIFIELKTAKGRTSDVQNAAIEQIEAAGSRVHVCRSLEDVIVVLKHRHGVKINGKLAIWTPTRGMEDEGASSVSKAC